MECILFMDKVTDQTMNKEVRAYKDIINKNKPKNIINEPENSEK